MKKQWLTNQMKLIKILLPFVCFLFALNASSQLPPKYLGLDSADFVQVYGSADEFTMQDGLSRSQRPEGGGNVVLIGKKIYWLNEISLFIQHNGFAKLDDVNLKGTEVWPFVERLSSNRDARKIFISPNVDKDNRILSVLITGSMSAVVNLFIFYWADYKASKIEWPSSGVVERHYISDRIVLRRVSDTQASITITK